MDIVIALLQYYSFDLGGHSIDSLLRQWSTFDPNWVRLAIVESLYQGRYKAISVSQILGFWQRKGEPHCRFNHEFERLVCGDFVFSLPAPRKLTYEVPKPSRAVPTRQIYSSQNLPKASVPSQKNKTPPLQQSQRQSQQTQQPQPSQLSEIDKEVVLGLITESSLFVDKLKSMCKDPIPRLSAPDRAIDAEASVPVSADL